VELARMLSLVATRRLTIRRLKAAGRQLAG